MAGWTFSPVMPSAPVKEYGSVDIKPGDAAGTRSQALRSIGSEFRRLRAGDGMYSMTVEGFYSEVGNWPEQYVRRLRDNVYTELADTVGIDRLSMYRTMTTSTTMGGVVRVRYSRGADTWSLGTPGQTGPIRKPSGPRENAAEEVEQESGIYFDPAEAAITTEIEITPTDLVKRSPIKLTLSVTIGLDGLEAVETSLKLFKKTLREKALLWGTVSNVEFAMKLNNGLSFANKEAGQLELEKFKTKLKASVKADVQVSVLKFPVEAYVYVDAHGGVGGGVQVTLVKFP